MWKPDPKVWNKINMKLRETGTNIRDLRHEIVLNETANMIRGYANDRAFLKAVEKGKTVPKKDRKKEIEDILGEKSIKEIYHTIMKVRRDRGESQGIRFKGTRSDMKELLMEGEWKIYLDDVIDI